ncbi:NAD-dependent epimerase/dehydratase family protein [Enterovibrio norvegicus]|uniref:NAD-dependent epimerase/dehydratase family protein n=1 Tax=Enterovibrio norvegicus TaxID=188144 RepID=UPI00354C9773
MKLLVTGSSGFVGAAFVELAESKGDTCIKQVRTPRKEQNGKNIFAAILSAETCWEKALNDVDCVVHCAALVHQTKSDCPFEAYRLTNTDGTVSLANQAAKAGVRHFIFLSSIKVNGESTTLGTPFTADVTNPPEDPYGLSKYEAEIALHDISQETGMKITIIRPPLVYGPGVKANFRSMLDMVHKGIPLPLRNTNNLRSLVFVGNLVDLMWQCTREEGSGYDRYLVSDGNDVSTSELLNDIGLALGKRARLFPFPALGIKLVTKLIGKPGICDRLYGNLQVDTSNTTIKLGWIPPFSYSEALRMTAKDYLENIKRTK